MTRICRLLGSLFLLLLLSPPAQAQLSCQYCNSTMPCRFNCYWNGNYNSTCIQSTGVCKRDPDADGIDWAADNCPETANPNQADCDGDGIGNVCDGRNGTFVPTGNRIACASDKKSYGLYADYELTYEQRYGDISACGAPDRWNHSRITQRCYLDCTEIDDNACGGACWNAPQKPGYECDYSRVCGNNLGDYDCHPDTI